MAKKRDSTDYRIVGCRGEWFAWHAHGHLVACRPHVRRIVVPNGKRLRSLTAVFGRTPFEALERLKRLEHTG